MPCGRAYGECCKTGHFWRIGAILLQAFQKGTLNCRGKRSTLDVWSCRFLRITLSGLRQVVTTYKLSGKRGISQECYFRGKRNGTHSTLHALSSTLYTTQTPLHTLHATFPTQPSTVFTLHTLHSTPVQTPQSTLVGSQGKNVPAC